MSTFSASFFGSISSWKTLCWLYVRTSSHSYSSRFTVVLPLLNSLYLSCPLWVDVSRYCYRCLTVCDVFNFMGSLNSAKNFFLNFDLIYFLFKTVVIRCLFNELNQNKHMSTCYFSMVIKFLFWWLNLFILKCCVSLFLNDGSKLDSI